MLQSSRISVLTRGATRPCARNHCCSPRAVPQHQPRVQAAAYRAAEPMHQQSHGAQLTHHLNMHHGDIPGSNGHWPPVDDAAASLLFREEMERQLDGILLEVAGTKARMRAVSKWLDKISGQVLMLTQQHGME